MPLSRRAFLTQSASFGAALAALAASPGPLSKLLGDAAFGAAGDLSAENLRTYVAVCEAICSFDGRTPPPARVDGRPAPTAADAGKRFAAEYRAQSPAMRQTFDLVLTLVEQAPRTPPPVGAASAQDFVDYAGRAFSQLDVPLRLRFVRSWAADFSTAPVGVQGFENVGALHRGIASALIQLGCFYYYQDPRSWRPLGYGGPWLHRKHESEELPFSHHGHGVQRVLYGGGVVA
jgi:hypothetical protein